MKRKLKWGIISTANIGLGRVIPGMQKSTISEVYAISSRDAGKAKAAAAQMGIPESHGSYEELLADPDIDVIYNPLPNHLHVEWSIKALEAGKHVLCEKPIGMNSGEGKKLLDASRRFPRLKIMEAFMYRHHPQWKRTKSLVEKGAIGDLKSVQSFFSYHNTDPQNVRNMAEIGGGGLMDIGCYCISFARFLFNGEPCRVVGLLDFDPNFGTDRMASGILDFGNGLHSTFTCSTQMMPYQRCLIVGTDGTIEIDIPVNAPPDRETQIWLKTRGTKEEIVFDVVDQYHAQCDAMVQAIVDDTPVPTPMDDAVHNMQVIDAIFESGKSGDWIDPSTL